MSDTQIYFVQRGEGGPIKIGKSRKVQERINTLKTGAAEKLEVLALYRGGDQTEKYLHKKLSAHRLEGEWFRPHQEVLDVVQSVVAGTFKPGTYAPITRDEKYHERVTSFLAHTFCVSLKIAYGTEPGWARQAAADAGVGPDAVKYWVRGQRLPHSAQTLNIAKNNPTMKAWFCTAGVATWLAREVGCDEYEAYAVALFNLDGVRRAWLAPKPDGAGLVLKEMWAERAVHAAAYRERAEKAAWVF